MATTRIMPLHIGKGRTESRAISDIIDYVANPQKTDNGKLITGSDTGAEQHRDLKKVINEFKVLHLRHPPASVVHISDAHGIKEPSRKLQEETPTAPS